MRTPPKQLTTGKHVDERGLLQSCELYLETQIQFKRFFIISNVIGGFRGGHAHKFTDQVITVVIGSCMLHIKYFDDDYAFMLDKNSSPIFLPKLSWVEMKNISKDCIILVFSSDCYDISNSLRTFPEYQEFIRHYDENV